MAKDKPAVVTNSSLGSNLNGMICPWASLGGGHGGKRCEYKAEIGYPSRAVNRIRSGPGVIPVRLERVSTRESTACATTGIGKGRCSRGSNCVMREHKFDHPMRMPVTCPCRSIV